MEGIKSIEYSFPKIEKMGSLKKLAIRGSNIDGYYFKEETKLEIIDLVDIVENSVVMYFYKGNEIEVMHVAEEDKFYEDIDEEYEYGILFIKSGGLSTEEASFVKSYMELRVGRENLGIGMVNKLESVEFMLGAEGVDLGEYVKKQSENEDKEESGYFYPRPDRYKDKARIRIEESSEGDLVFILVKGSNIVLPDRGLRNYVRTGVQLYDRNARILSDLYDKGKLRQLGNRVYEVLEDVKLGSPSAVATLITGMSVNGWDFFEGIEKYRK